MSRAQLAPLASDANADANNGRQVRTPPNVRSYLTSQIEPVTLDALVLANNEGTSDVNELGNRLACLRELDNLLGGVDTFRLYGNELTHTGRLLNYSTFGQTTRVALTVLAAEQAQQAGWAAFDAGHTAAALRLYEYSHRVAKEADDLELAANALIQIAYATGRWDSVDAADAACKTVHPGASAKSRAPRIAPSLVSRRRWRRAKRRPCS